MFEKLIIPCLVFGLLSKIFFWPKIVITVILPKGHDAFSFPFSSGIKNLGIKVEPLTWLSKDEGKHNNIKRISQAVTLTAMPPTLYKKSFILSSKSVRIRNVVRNVVAVIQSLSHVWLFVTPWTTSHQAPLSIWFPRQEYWSLGCCFLLQGIFLGQGLSSRLLYWQDSLPLNHQESPHRNLHVT